MIQLYFSISAFVLLFTAQVKCQSPVYGQCGGQNWTGPTTCESGSTCVYSNDWYSQCLPISTTPSPNESPMYGQCGGEGWTGPTICVSTATCVYSNPWYSQCLPSSGSQPTTTTTTSTITETTTTTTTTTTTAASSQSEAPLYGQCGGQEWTGPTSCVSGSTCVYSNPWYSQCLPNDSSQPTTTTTIQTTTTAAPTTTTTTTASSEAPLYGQCGGQEWTGPTTCVSGATCVYSNPWYSQCLQSSSSSPTTSSTQTTPSSSTITTTTASNTASTTASSSSTTAQSGTSGGTNYASNGDSFINGKFKVGIDYNYITNNPNMDLSPYDYITIWMNTVDYSGSTAWNPWYQGKMLEACTNYNKIPVFYAYVIAFEARSKWNLQDCDASWNSQSLCQRGSDFIRQYRQYLVDRYSQNAGNISATYGRDKVVVFLIEPDFWQYFGDTTTQQNGALSATYMRDLFNDFVSAIKAQLPNALISWDISAWIGQDGSTGFKEWWSYFKDSQIDFVHTSGGQAHGELANIKPNELTWNFVSSHTGKKIIADCGYGVSGQASNNCGVWSDSNNENARINDGVVSLSVAYPSGTVAKPSLNCC